MPSALRAGLKLKRFPSQHSCSDNRSKPVSQVLPATGGRSLSNRLLQQPSSRPDSGCESSILAAALNTVELTWSVFRHPCRNDKFSTCRRFFCLFKAPQHPCCAVIEQFSSFHIVSLCFLNVSHPLGAKRACAGFAPRAICPTYCL